MGTIDKYTPAQRVIHTELLEIGEERPVARNTLQSELRDHIASGVSRPLMDWTESKLRLHKSGLSQALKCGGLLRAVKERDAAQTDPFKSRKMFLPTMVGTVTHQAVQLYTTLPDSASATLSWVVDKCLEHNLVCDEKFAASYDVLTDLQKSDLKVQALSKVTAFLDTWPPLQASWHPRFEEPISTMISGGLVLSGRPDFMLGRPKYNMVQSMVIVDLKTGELNDSHEFEASFYALLSTLKNGVPPFKSVVFSLASNTYTDTPVNESTLFDTADKVIEAVTTYVAVLTEQPGSENMLTPGPSCVWCPASATCSAVQT